MSTFLLFSCTNNSARQASDEQTLANQIKTDSFLTVVERMAEDLVKTGFNAGDGYGEVWIRDYNTFITLACEVHDKQKVRNNLLLFFKFQGEDGDIVDGFIPITKALIGYKYRYSNLAPQYAAHKNTVETDQEASLVQAVGK